MPHRSGVRLARRASPYEIELPSDSLGYIQRITLNKVMATIISLPLDIYPHNLRLWPRLMQSHRRATGPTE